MKRKKAKISKEKERGLVWESLRVSFWAMIGFWIFFMIAPFSDFLLGTMWMGVTLFNFIISIIHLTEYKEKRFAITSLVFSSIFLFFFLLGALISFIQVFAGLD
jgi:hypothetical protein